MIPLAIVTAFAADPLLACPPATDGQRFLATVDGAKSAMRFNRQYRDQMVEPVRDDQYEAYRDAVADLQRRWEAWDWLQAGLGGEGSGYGCFPDWAESRYLRGEDWHRYCLYRLRLLIGDECFGNGVMPCHVPLENFREIP